MLRPDAVPLLAAVYYCSWGRRAALPPPPARFATRSLLHANGVTHDARSARHSQRKGAACGQRHGTAARGNSHALPKIPQALQRAESSKSRAQGTMSVGCTRPPPATPRRLCEVLQGRRSLRAMIQKRQKHANAGNEKREGGTSCRLSCSGSNTPLVGLVLGGSDSASTHDHAGMSEGVMWKGQQTGSYPAPATAVFPPQPLTKEIGISWPSERRC